MNNNRIKVGNVYVVLPETTEIAISEHPQEKKTFAERGDEAKPLEQLPEIPNPNDFVGSAMFQVHAIGKVRTADKKWVKTTGMIVFSIVFLVPIELPLLFGGINNGSWVPFVLFNVGVVAFFYWRRNVGRKRSG